MSDDVKSPAHYTAGEVEFIEAAEAMLGPEGFKAFCRGNAMKYLWRCERKGDAFKDVSKAHWYVCRWLDAYVRYEGSESDEAKCSMTDDLNVIWSDEGQDSPSADGSQDS